MNQHYPDMQQILTSYGDVLHESDAGEILKTYNLITKKQAFLCGLLEDVSRDQVCVTADDVCVVKEDASNIERAEANFKAVITSILDGCRSERSNAGHIGQFCRKNMQFLCNNHPNGKHHPITEKLDLYKKLLQKNVFYIGRLLPTALNNLNEAEEMFVLYYHECLSKADPQEWTQLLEKFFVLVDQAALAPGGPTFTFIDCELSGQAGPEGTKVNEIVRYRNGEPVADESADSGGDEGIPLAKSTITPEKGKEPKKSGNVVLPCPASSKRGRCPQGIHSWKCFECQQPLEYGFDDHIYCKCGRCPAEAYTFRCGQPRHRTEYVGFDPSVLTTLLDKTEPFKEINILILGETGVGKSTWINGFVNFVTYPTLDEALHEPVYLIPAHFSMMDEKYEMRKVSMGNSENEDETPGQSCTQMPKTYVFKKDNSIIRLIDTPGIGDTRGADQDKKNFQFIMNHLSHYESVHGICILLKPNNARLTVMFQFCIKELLTHLHRDACQNIVFVFTNARSTFYKPGDTYQALQKLIDSSKGIKIKLERDTVYCVDNEAVRFMAALKTGITFPDKEKDNFKTSWETSVAETDRLLQYICKRTPHMLRQTLSLNEARRQILAFTEPLAHITKNIHINIQAADDKADEVLQLQHSKQDLQGRLYVPMIDLESIPLPYPRTVCVAQKCIKMVGSKVNYVTWCHEHCYLTGIVPGAYPQPGLQRCAAMDSTRMKCHRCGCAWDLHMHIEYELHEIETRQVDPNVQDLLLKRDGNIMAVQAMLQDLEDRKDQLKHEMDEITKVASKFGYFLKTNAMIPYNDAMEEYLRYLIRAEEEKVAIGASRKNLEDYQQTLRNYQEEKKLLEEAMLNSSQHQQITAVDIEDGIRSLYELPLNGQMIKNLVETKNYTEGQQTQHSETFYSPEKQKRKPQPNIIQKGWNFLTNFMGFRTNQDLRNNFDDYSGTSRGASGTFNQEPGPGYSNRGPNSSVQTMPHLRSSSRGYPEMSSNRNYPLQEPPFYNNFSLPHYQAEQMMGPNSTYGDRRPSNNTYERSLPSYDSYFGQTPPSARGDYFTGIGNAARAPYVGDQTGIPTFGGYNYPSNEFRDRNPPPPFQRGSTGAIPESRSLNKNRANLFDAVTTPQYGTYRAETTERFNERHTSPNMPYSVHYGSQPSSNAFRAVPPQPATRVAPGPPPQPSRSPSTSTHTVSSMPLKPYEGKKESQGRTAGQYTKEVSKSLGNMQLTPKKNPIKK